MKKFKLLVLGGDHVYGHQIAAGQSFVEQLTRRLTREGLSVIVECHAPLSLPAMIGLLPRLPLSQYDLIVLQPGHHELRRPATLADLLTTQPRPSSPAEPVMGKTRRYFRPVAPLVDLVKLAGLQLMNGLTGLPRLQQTRTELRTVLDGLQSCGHNVILVTPFPHPDAISNWLRQQGRRLFLEEGYRAFMPVFDAYPLLDLDDVCFLPDAPACLNPLGHELVGSALYDFFRAGVVVAGDSSSYRRHD